MAIRIQIRRDTAANWQANNPILAEGELGIELDTTLMKVGDGVTAWNDLGYINEGDMFTSIYDKNKNGIVDNAEKVNNMVPFAIQTITGTNVDWNIATYAKITLTADVTLTFTDPAQPAHLTLEVVQDDTGGHTLTLPTIKWAGGIAPTLSTAANNISVISLFWDGSQYLGMASDSFA